MALSSSRRQALLRFSEPWFLRAAEHRYLLSLPLHQPQVAFAGQPCDRLGALISGSCVWAIIDGFLCPLWYQSCGVLAVDTLSGPLRVSHAVNALIDRIERRVGSLWRRGK